MSRVLTMLQKFGRVDTYLVKRDDVGPVRIKGKSVQNPNRVELTISASIQPVNGDEVKDEAIGGERNKHYIRIYSDVELKVADERTGYKSDIIVFRGEEYEIQLSEDWTHNNLSLKHFKAFAYRVNNPGVK